MGYFGPKGPKRAILAQKGPFWLKKGHFGSKRAFLDPFGVLGRTPKMGHFGPKRAILAPFGGPGRTLQKARVWPILGAIPMVPFWLKMALLGGPGGTSQKGPFWVKKTQKGSFWLKKGHFDPLLGSWGGPQKGPFWPKKGLFGSKRLKKGHFGSKWAILAQKGPPGRVP